MVSTEKRIRFNILDIILIIIVVTLIIGIFFRDNITGLLNTNKSEEINYTFEIKQLDYERLTKLTQNTAFFESESGNAMGKVINVNSVKSKVKEYTIDGNIIEFEKNNYYDVIVKAVANGFKNNNGVFIDGNVLIVPGKTYNINTSTAVYAITILSTN